MPNRQRKTITERQWREAVDAYELGFKNATQLARELGTSPSTVSREFKQRGAQKACRVAETVAGLEATLDAKIQNEARRRDEQWLAAAERCAVLDKLIGDMVNNLIAADRTGNLSAAGPDIARIGKALGVKPAR